MAEPPEVQPERVARALRQVVAAALNRATKASQHSITALASNTVASFDVTLARAQGAVRTATARATTAQAQHERINELGEPTRHRR